MERIRNRYVESKISEVKDGFTYDFEEHDAKSLVDKLQHALKDIQKVSANSKQAYDQKPIREYVSEFKEDYVARMKDPNLGQGILTGYSY